MGQYPNKYSIAAILVAENVVKPAVQSRLVKEGWYWKAPVFLVSGRDLDEIRSRFAPGVSENELVSFVGLVFSKVLPEIHYEFTSDGFYLGISTDTGAIVVKELPECSQVRRQKSHKAALKVVRSLLEWKITSFREANDGKWPVGEWGGADLIHGELYRFIKGFGEFSYCRTRNVIEFIQEAVPKLFDQWEQEGLVLIPKYHIEGNGRGRFTTLRLVPKTPA